MKTNGDDLAIPSHQALEQLNPNAHDARNLISGGGLTKREYFAALAMQGSICADDHESPDWITMEIVNAHAKKAVMIADALITALNTQATEPEELK